MERANMSTCKNSFFAVFTFLFLGFFLISPICYAGEGGIFSSPKHSSEIQKESTNIEGASLQASSLDYEQDSIIASGEAKLVKKNIVIIADKIIVNKTIGSVEAIGNVKVFSLKSNPSKNVKIRSISQVKKEFDVANDTGAVLLLDKEIDFGGYISGAILESIYLWNSNIANLNLKSGELKVNNDLVISDWSSFKKESNTANIFKANLISVYEDSSDLFSNDIISFKVSDSQKIRTGLFTSDMLVGKLVCVSNDGTILFSYENGAYFVKGFSAKLGTKFDYNSSEGKTIAFSGNELSAKYVFDGLFTSDFSIKSKKINLTSSIDEKRSNIEDFDISLGFDNDLLKFGFKLDSKNEFKEESGAVPAKFEFSNRYNTFFKLKNLNLDSFGFLKFDIDLTVGDRGTDKDDQFNHNVSMTYGNGFNNVIFPFDFSVNLKGSAFDIGKKSTLKNDTDAVLNNSLISIGTSLEPKIGIFGIKLSPSYVYNTFAQYKKENLVVDSEVVFRNVKEYNYNENTGKAIPGDNGVNLGASDNRIASYTIGLPLHLGKEFSFGDIKLSMGYDGIIEMHSNSLSTDTKNINFLKGKKEVGDKTHYIISKKIFTFKPAEINASLKGDFKLLNGDFKINPSLLVDLKAFRCAKYWGNLKETLGGTETVYEASEHLLTKFDTYNEFGVAITVGMKYKDMLSLDAGIDFEYGNEGFVKNVYKYKLDNNEFSEITNISDISSVIPKYSYNKFSLDFKIVKIDGTFLMRLADNGIKLSKKPFVFDPKLTVKLPLDLSFTLGTKIVSSFDLLKNNIHANKSIDKMIGGDDNYKKIGTDKPNYKDMFKVGKLKVSDIISYDKRDEKVEGFEGKFAPLLMNKPNEYSNKVSFIFGSLDKEFDLFGITITKLSLGLDWNYDCNGVFNINVSETDLGTVNTLGTKIFDKAVSNDLLKDANNKFTWGIIPNNFALNFGFRLSPILLDDYILNLCFNFDYKTPKISILGKQDKTDGAEAKPEEVSSIKFSDYGYNKLPKVSFGIEYSPKDSDFNFPLFEDDFTNK